MTAVPDKVLVAAGDGVLRDTLRGLFGFHGLYVQCASEAADAIRLGIVMRPDALVATDGLAGGTSGVDVARSLHRELPDLVIVLLAGDDPEYLAAQCADLPVAAIVEQPFGHASLHEIVAKCLADRGREPPPQAS